MKNIIIIFFVFMSISLLGKNVYLDNANGSNTNSGLNKKEALKDISSLESIVFEGGDSILFASGQFFPGMLTLSNVHAEIDNPVVVTTFFSRAKDQLAHINGENNEAAIRIINCSGITIKNIAVSADGSDEVSPSAGIGKMRCGILVLGNEVGVFSGISIDHVEVSDVFYPETGQKRGKDDVKTANGNLPYGWGIRIINADQGALMQKIIVSNCSISNVGHTGIKFTVQKNNGEHRIQHIEVHNNKVIHTGGPGIQMSGIKNGHIYENNVDHSGSTSDTRKWGRGSGLWTWGSENVLIERNKFTNANGPADSAGAHIDFNCRNIVIQYNFSANNAGGFCEILGNNYNCCYRYNISVNDGHRVKGEKDAFQEGKIFWLSGYQGKKERNGPFNSYFYNNTIYISNDIVAKIAVDKASGGVLIANNIFHIEGESKVVLGDQYNPEKKSANPVTIPNVVFTNNVFLNDGIWPKEVLVQPNNSILGNVGFDESNMEEISNFIPKNVDLVKDKGIEIVKIPGDEIGIVYGLSVKIDILGNAIEGIPDIGAIEIK